MRELCKFDYNLHTWYTCHILVTYVFMIGFPWIYLLILFLSKTLWPGRVWDIILSRHISKGVYSAGWIIHFIVDSPMIYCYITLCLSWWNPYLMVMPYWLNIIEIDDMIVIIWFLCIYEYIVVNKLVWRLHFGMEKEYTFQFFKMPWSKINITDSQINW